MASRKSGIPLAPPRATTGTPTAAGTFPVTVEVTDAGGKKETRALSIVIHAVPAITTASLPGGSVERAYSAALAASGGTAPLKWSVQSGALPSGLTLNDSTGVIAGTPDQEGSYTFTVRVTDAAGASAERALTLAIAPVQPNIELALTLVTTGDLNVGDTVVVELRATNRGTRPVTGLVFPGSGGLAQAEAMISEAAETTDNVRVVLERLGATATIGTINPTTGDWTIEKLDPQQTAIKTIRFVLKLNGGF